MNDELLEEIGHAADLARRADKAATDARIARDYRIQVAREAGLSLRAIAAAAGIHYTTILKIERQGGSR